MQDLDVPAEHEAPRTNRTQELNGGGSVYYAGIGGLRESALHRNGDAPHLPSFTLPRQDCPTERSETTVLSTKEACLSALADTTFSTKRILPSVRDTIPACSKQNEVESWLHNSHQKSVFVSRPRPHPKSQPKNSWHAPNVDAIGISDLDYRHYQPGTSSLNSGYFLLENSIGHVGFFFHDSGI